MRVYYYKYLNFQDLILNSQNLVLAAAAAVVAAAVVTAATAAVVAVANDENYNQKNDPSTAVVTKCITHKNVPP